MSNEITITDFQPNTLKKSSISFLASDLLSNDEATQFIVKTEVQGYEVEF